MKPVFFTIFSCVFLFRLLFAQEKVSDTKFSHSRGFYDSTIQVKLTSATVGATIRYTLDGSEPNENYGTLYTHPIPISTTRTIRAMAYHVGKVSTNVDAHTYIFLQHVIQQPKYPAGFPRQWQSENGERISADYEMDPDYPADDETIKAALLALPTVSISMNPADLFEEGGMYNNGGRNANAAWEMPCSAEFIYPKDESRSFQINCGIQPRSHRPTSSRKRGFRLDFKSMYGPSKLQQPIFDDSIEIGDGAAEEFDSIIFRSGFMENYTGKGYNPNLNIYFRDVLTRTAQLSVQGYGTRNQFKHVYLNGLYWGVYNMTEAIEPDFLESYFGGDADADTWLIVKSNPDSHDDGYLVAGTPDRYHQLLKLVSEKNFENPDVYETVQTLIDPVAFADYIILQNYHAVGDWPDNNWVFVQRNGLVQEPGFFFIWDAEKTWLEDDDPQSHPHAWYSPYLWDDSRDVYINKGLKSVPARLWNAFIENIDFRMLFADRVYKHLYVDGPLSNLNTHARFEGLAGLLSRAVRADQKRWSDDDNRDRQPGYTFTHQHWQKEVDRVRGNIEYNAEEFIADFQAHDLYPSIDPPYFSRMGGNVPNNFVLTISNPNINGEIHFTRNGDDPRVSGGAVSPGAQRGEDKVDIWIQGTRTIKARVKQNGSWSPLQQATFYGRDDFSAIKITEIMYHPPDYEGIDGDEFEFIEIKNTGGERINMSNMVFTDGIEYRFKENFFLNAQEFIVLAENDRNFALKYKKAPFDQYKGRLNNSGERVTLSDGRGGTIFSVKYGNVPPWPTEPDSGGYSLVPVDYNENPNPDFPTNWRASLYELGSPGYDDSCAYVLPDPPPASKELLFVVAEKNLDADDKVIFDRLSGQGYLLTTVTAKSAGAADAHDKAGVLISESVNSGDVHATFRDIKLPVFVWEPYVYDDMDMTGDNENIDYGKLDHTTISITAPGHDLAAGISGNARVLENSVECSWGKPSGSAIVVGNWQDQSNKAAIFAYDRGAQMVGRIAQARRVGFFFNGGITQTTMRGWQLFDAAMSWAFGPPQPPTNIHKNQRQLSPQEFTLNQNYPNPFNSSTLITFDIGKPAHVHIFVYNIKGQKVRTVVDEILPDGHYVRSWNALDDNNSPVAAGIYFYQMKINGLTITSKKMLLMK